MKKWMLCFLSAIASASAAEPLLLIQDDWELACDNLGTCRAVAYAQENSDAAFLVSLLFTYPAGEAMQPIQIRLETSDENISEIELFLQEKSLGKVLLEGQMAELSPAQSASIVQGMIQKQALTVQLGRHQNAISLLGSEEILQQLNDFQKRFPAPQKIPEIIIPEIPDINPLVLDVKSELFQRIKTQLQTLKINEENTDFSDCYLYDEDEKFQPQIYPLNAETQLIEIPCTLGAYNAESFYIVYQPETHHILQKVGKIIMNSHYENGLIESFSKGRGLGDCWSNEIWAWNGEYFVLAEEAGSFLCRGFSGGAWLLPLFQSKIIHQ